jgi:hypothetical protein
MKKEGALTKRFLRHNGIYRSSDVSSLLFTPGPLSRFPVGPVPGYRASRKEHAPPIVRDEFRPAIPRRVARQHCPSPVHRHFQDNSYPLSAERIYHRTVDSVLTVCLTKRGNPTSVRCVRHRRGVMLVCSRRYEDRLRPSGDARCGHWQTRPSVARALSQLCTHPMGFSVRLRGRWMKSCAESRQEERIGEYCFQSGLTIRSSASTLGGRPMSSGDTSEISGDGGTTTATKPLFRDYYAI